MNSNENTNCETCRFSHNQDPDGFAKCRRHPKVWMKSFNEAGWTYPEVLLRDWCGEWESTIDYLRKIKEEELKAKYQVQM